MLRSQTIISRANRIFLRHVANPNAFVPIVTISQSFCANMNCYETIQYLPTTITHKELKERPPFNIPVFKIQEFEFSASVYEEPRNGSKSSILRHIRSLMLKPSVLEKHQFTKTSLQIVVDSAHLKKWIFLKITDKSNEYIIQKKPLYIIVCLKIASDKKDGKIYKKGDKLDIELIINEKDWNKKTLFDKLNLFAWTLQFGNFIKKISKYEYYSVNTSAFYYKCIFYGLTDKDDKNDYIWPLRNGQLIKSYNDCENITVLRPFLFYQPETISINTINFWLINNEKKIHPQYLPIAHNIYLKVIAHDIAEKVYYEYLNWVFDEKAVGHHEIRRSGHTTQGSICRIKSYIHAKYWYNSEEYKNLKKSFKKKYKKKKKKIRFANDNLGGGLRIIDYNKPKPDFILRLISIISKLPSPDYFDQIGIVLYKNVTNSDETFVGLASHDEWEKFEDLWQLNLGLDSLLTFDGGGGDVNATVGLPLPAQSLVHHDMQSYFHCGRKFGGGGKHSVARRHLRLSSGQWRLAILFRRCVPSALKEAIQHYLKCNNKDHHCYCLNPCLSQ